MRGLIAPNPGQIQVDPGVIITGYEGDPMLNKRPHWAKDGTFMVFRKLQQLVPEFQQYLADNGPRWKEFVPKVDTTKELTDKEGAALWGARMIGRWPSGTPIANAPVFDDPAMAQDPKRNNNFDYTIPGYDLPTDKHCPFSAHTRKTAPRNLDPFLAKKFLEGGSIIRAGIPFGDEVSAKEQQTHETDPDPGHWRGLLFVAYQSDLNSGFVRQTVQYANNDYSPTVSLIPEVHGQDPILGGPPHPLSDPITIDKTQPVESGDQVHLTILNAQGDRLDVQGFASLARHGVQPPPGVPQQFFVNSRGGEYFFVPSIETVKALAASQ
jgi:Dyp-type peroxidase family